MMTTRSWEEVSAPYRKDGEAEKIEAIKQAMVDAIALSELRQLRDVSQAELAKALGTSQPRVSTLERQRDLYLSTLQEYVRALGGELEVTAVFGDDRVLIGVGD